MRLSGVLQRKRRIYLARFLLFFAFFLFLTFQREVFADAAELKLALNASETECAISLDKYAMPSGGESVRAAIWSEKNGQDDLKWLVMKKNTSGVYTLNLPVEDYGRAGRYFVHVYMRDTSGKMTFVAKDEFSVSEAKAASVEIQNLNNTKGTATVVIKGAEAPSGISSMQVPTWSKSDQSDIYWYQAKQQADGTWTTEIDLSRHNFRSGSYNCHVYATANNKVFNCIGKTTATFAFQGMEPAVQVKDSSLYVRSGTVSVSGTLASVQAAIWSETKGQDDLKWVDLTKNASSGIYEKTVALSGFRGFGLYHVHIYAKNSKGAMTFIGNTTVDVKGPSAEGITCEKVNGTYVVKASAISCDVNLKSVQAAVWSEDKGQDDLNWYSMSKNADGSWQCSLDLSKHKYTSGVYNVHLYATGENTVQAFAGSVRPEIKYQTAAIKASVSGSNLAVDISDLELPGGVAKTSVAIWSDKNGQDDLKWVEGSYNSTDLTSKATAALSSFKDFGKYNIHVYAVDKNGKSVFAGAVTVDVPGPSVQSIEIIKQDGKYAAKLTGVSCVTGVKKIVVPTWSAADQSDLVWYDAAKQSDGSYLAPFAMTNNKPGSYVSHVYVTDNRGCQAFAGSKNFTVELSAGDLSATSDQNKTEFAYTVKDLFVPVGYSNIRAAVWSDNKGQDDLTWYNVSVKGDTGSFTMPMSEHGDEGNYNIHLYAFKSNGTAMLVKKYTYDVDLTGCIRFVNRTLGSVDAIVRLPKDITAERVAYAVWCADNQSDMYWYTAEQQADGSYKAGISIANHQNHGGTYKVHAYYYDGKDAGHLINTTSIDLYGSFSADVNSCLITDGSSVEVKAGISGDGAKHTYGLFVLKPGKTKITSTATPVATAEGYGNVVIKAPLNLNGAGSLLTEKLVLAVKNGSSYTQISDGSYITNPEAVASNKRAFPTQRTKKGLQVKQEMLSDAAELGVKHAVINITLNDMVSKSGGIPYTYKGKTYYMDSGYIGRLDATTSSLASRGVVTSAVLLMQYDSECPELISPPARSAGHDLYEVNVTEEGPRNHLAALFSFLAERYSDSGHNVVNWIMGNEVSDYTHYNWGGNVSVDTFARNYTDAFRLLYNCAKSKYGNARIYISLDQFFNMARSYAYAGNEIFNRFVAQLQKEGDINWCMAYHPYPYPITDANFWAKRADVTNSADSRVFTLLNLKYLTDYIKNTYGSQHRFILSEQGFTSVSNGKTDERLQAAAMAYGYYLAEFNDMVDSFVLHRHVDHLVEQQMGLYLGLWNNNSGSYEVATSKKLAWTVYKYMDTSSCQSYTNFALSVIGANSWSEIVPGYTAARFGN